MSVSRLRSDYAGFMVGFSALWVQVVLIRRLIAAFSGNELTIGVVLAAWMIWSGLGAFGPGRYVDRLRHSGNWLSFVFILVSLVLVPVMLFSARVRPFLGASPGEVSDLLRLLIACFMLSFPLSAVLGFAFNLAARMQEDFQQAAGRTYRFEALGAFLAGGVLAIWFGGASSPMLPALVMTAVLAASALLVCNLASRGGRIAAFVAGLLLTALLAGSLFFSLPSRISRAYEALYWGEQDVGRSFDSRHGYLAAVRRGGQVTFYEDGSPAGTFPDAPSTEVLSHVSLSMCGSPERVLLVGGGLSGMGGDILEHPVERLDYLQLDPGWIELEQSFTSEFERLSSDPRVRVRVDDARHWLRGKQGFYDAVIINLPDPLTAELNRFYTREFFQQVKRSLSPGGVMALTAGSTPPNLNLTRGELGLLAGVSATVDAVFDKRVILPVGDNLVVAGGSKARLFRSADAIHEVLERRGIDSEYASRYKLGAELSPYNLEQIEAMLDEIEARPDRDLHPGGYLYGIMLWAERATPELARALSYITSLPPWSLLIIPALVLFSGFLWCLSGGGRAEAALASGVSGFCAIVIEVSVMISFQMLVGAVYFALSVLTAAFMIGLSGGAYLQEKLTRPAGLFFMEWVLVLWCALVTALVWGMTKFSGGTGALVVFSFLLFVQGVVAGALFYSASRAVILSREEVGRGVGLVYGLELFGSALGGLISGVLLVPVFGLSGAMFCAVLCAVSVLVVSAGRYRRRAGG
ncbi:MAG: hypothetical protein R6V10_03035 [bacterium]